MQHPFERGFERYQNGMLEYRAFLETWRPIYEDFEVTSKEFRDLKLVYSAWSDDTHPSQFAEPWTRRNMPVPMLPTLQITFGRRPYGLGRLTHELKSATEHGPTLVYSPGAMGAIAVILYPVNGDLAHVDESALILRQGFYTAHELRKFFPKDLKTLVDYGFVTAFDASPTWRQRFHIWRLRKLRHRIGRGENAPPIPGVAVGALVRLTAGTIAKSALVAAFKPIGVAVALLLIYALTKSGFFEWISLQSIPAAIDLTR